MEREPTQFTKLNEGWNAEPNAPMPHVFVEATTLVLTFGLNLWTSSEFRPTDRGVLRFGECWRYRIGETNDEGWWRGQCRFSRLAPAWGEFYEVKGDLRLEELPKGAWSLLGQPRSADTKHFLFYFKDETFECDASAWDFKVISASDDFI